MTGDLIKSFEEDKFSKDRRFHKFGKFNKKKQLPYRSMNITFKD